MKKLKYLLSIILLFAVFSAFSQVEIQKSTDKVRIGDKVYFLHLVKQGETIYSLCRVYNVSQEELLSENPQLDKGLKTGQRLRIPEKPEKQGKATEVAKTTPTTPATSAKTVENKNSENTDKKETADKKENVDMKETVNAVESAIKHKIKSGDNLEAIAKQYNCSVEDILTYNTFLDRNSKLKKGQYLTIYPNKNDRRKIETVAEKTPQSDTISSETQEFEETGDCYENPYPDETLNVALLLPIKASEINSNSMKDSRNAYNVIEFYEGFLLAIDSLSRRNISVNISTFDVYNEKTLKSALNSQDFEDAQLVISYAEKDTLGIIAKTAAKHKIPVVSPFSQEVEDITAKTKYFIQTSTPMPYQNEKISKILCDAKDNIIVVYEKITDTTNYENLIKLFKSCGKNVKTYHYTLSNSDNLRNVLDNRVKNNVLVVSNNYAFVVDVLSRLNVIYVSSKCDITVYGSSLWKSFENNLSFDHIHNLNLSLLQQSFIDYNRDEVKNFISKYRHYYKGDPSYFSFQGYDLGIYFVDKLAKYGQDFMHCITQENTETLLQTRLKFSKVSKDGGLVNTETLLLRHTKDFNTVVE